MGGEMLRKASLILVVAIAPLAVVHGQERAQCPDIRHIDLVTEKGSNIVRLRFETENRQDAPVDAELRVGWHMNVAARALPQFGGKITEHHLGRRIKLEITAPPGKERHEEHGSLDQQFSDDTFGAVNRSLQSMSRPMAAESETIRLYRDSNYDNGFS